MTGQSSLAFLGPAPTTLCGRVLAVLERHRGEWVDARQLLEVGGYAGWRTRISELRTIYGYQVENRWREVEHGGRRFRITEYKLL